MGDHRDEIDKKKPFRRFHNKSKGQHGLKNVD